MRKVTLSLALRPSKWGKVREMGSWPHCPDLLNSQGYAFIATSAQGGERKTQRNWKHLSFHILSFSQKLSDSWKTAFVYVPCEQIQTKPKGEKCIKEDKSQMGPQLVGGPKSHTGENKINLRMSLRNWNARERPTLGWLGRRLYELVVSYFFLITERKFLTPKVKKERFI